MLPATAYLSSPDILHVPYPRSTADTALDRSSGSARSLWFRGVVTTIVVLLSTLAVAAPSWAGPTGGC